MSRFTLQHQTQPAFDRRKLVGPDSSTPIPTFNSTKEIVPENTKDNLRPDGRTNQQFRPIR